MLLPTDSNKLLFQWKGPYDVVEVVDRMYYKVDVDGIVNTYHANMLKLYVDRQNLTSYCLMSAEANLTVDEEVENKEFSIDFRWLSSRNRSMM